MKIQNTYIVLCGNPKFGKQQAIKLINAHLKKWKTKELKKS